MRFVAERVLAGVGLAILLAAANPAFAQNTQNLVNEIQRLQRDIADLQRQVYGGGSTRTATPVTSAPLSSDGNTAASSLPADVSASARNEVRLQQLETQIRQLTGKLEENAFNVERISGRLDKLVSDIDFRLQQLEQRGVVAPAPAATGEMAAAGQQPLATGTSDQLTPPVNALQPQQSSEETGEVKTLGTIPQSQLTASNAQNPVPAGQAQAQPSAPVAAPSAPAQSQQAAIPAPSALPQGTPADQYKFAFDKLVKHDYSGAEKAFRAFVDQHSDDILAGNAQYWLGETYYVRENFAEAAISFATGYQSYPKSSKAADNLLKLGMSLARLGKNEDACHAFARLGQEFPKAPSNVRRRANAEKNRLSCKA